MTRRLRPILALSLLALASSALSPAQPDDLERSVALMAKIANATSPSFGKRIAYVSNLNGIPQVWIVDAAGGYPQLVTAFDDPVGFVEWSPGGAWLAFTLAPGGGMNLQVYLVRPDGSGLRRLTDGGKETNSLGLWSYDGSLLAFGSNRRSGDAIDAYVYDVAGGTSRLVSQNRGIGEFADLTRDKKLALLDRLVNRGDNNLYAVELATGKETLLTPHQGPGSFSGAFAKDGRAVYLETNANRDLTAFARLEISPTATPGKVTILAERPDAELSAFDLDDAGTTAALIWNVSGKSDLELLDLTTRKSILHPKLPADIAGGLDFSRDGKSLALVLSGSAAPADIWVMDVASGASDKSPKVRTQAST